jgi:hypothetical protein
MDMDWRDIALALGGVIGSVVALVHGALVQRLMVRPIDTALRDHRRTGAVVGRMLGPLMQFSTFNWFIGGLALAAAAAWATPEVRLVTALLVGASYLYGAVGNLWATRGRHPGWALYTVALGLIVVGVA